MEYVSGGEAVVKSLKEAGVDTIFGIPGTQNLAIFDALAADPAITLITARHEQGAAFMADGYARVTGRPGICLTVSGPGAGNTLTPLGQAYSDSSPVLLVSSQVHSWLLDRDRESFHDLRHAMRVFESVTKWRGRARDVSTIPVLVRDALRTITSGRRRPGYLEIPCDVLESKGWVEIHALDFVAPIVPPGSLLEAASRRLRTAKRPALYLGGGVARSEAKRAVLALAERLQAPIITSMNGKGAVPDGHPLVVGGGWGAHQIGAQVISKADVVLALGTRFDPLSTNYWHLEFPELIHVDVDSAELGKHYTPTIGIVGDVGITASRLVALLDHSGFATPSQCWTNVAAHRQERLRQIDDRAGSALQVVRALRASLPDDAVLFNDLNIVSYWSWPGYEVVEPETFNNPSGFGCLGFALPAAIGARIGAPNRPTVALIGDGGFLYTVQELATAVHHRIAVVVIVFNNNAYGAVREDQRLNWAGRTIGVDLTNPDMVRLAEAFGARAVRVDSAEAIGAVVSNAIESPGPTVIEAPAPAVAPPWIP